MKEFLPYYRHLRDVKWPFLIGVACGLVYAVASGAGLPLMTKVVFPVLFNAESEAAKPYEIWVRERIGGISHDHLLLVTCLWIPFIFLIRALAGYANSYLIQFSGLRVLEAIRTDMFVKLQGLPLSFFKKNRSGDLLARLMSDTEVLRQVIATASSDLIKQPATLLAALGVLVYLAVKDHSFFIALIALITVPICVTVIRSAGKRLASPGTQPPKTRRRPHRHAHRKPAVIAGNPRLQSGGAPDHPVPQAHPGHAQSLTQGRQIPSGDLTVHRGGGVRRICRGTCFSVCVTA